MAIIKCDEGLPPEPTPTGSGDDALVEPYIEQDKVSLGKMLLAVESSVYSPSTPLVDVLPEVRSTDISDTFRADAGLYWYLSDEQKMIHLNGGYISITESDVQIQNTGSLGMSKTQSTIDISGDRDYFISTDKWDAIVDGTDDSRSSPLIPVGDSFEDHAFQMNTPFSKKELEMFANIEGDIYVADVESDYDFYFKTYEEGIAATTVPENALPHLYTEVQRGESEAENTIISATTEKENQVEEGYFREWINTVLSNQDTMNEIAEDYENVAILDSAVSDDYILDSETQTTSAFEILMAYANRENLFPMNINIEVGVNKETPSDLMFKAEEVGMVDEIVKMLMGDGSIVDATPPSDTSSKDSSPSTLGENFTNLEIEGDVDKLALPDDTKKSDAEALKVFNKSNDITYGDESLLDVDGTSVTDINQEYGS